MLEPASEGRRKMPLEGEKKSVQCERDVIFAWVGVGVGVCLLSGTAL